MARVFLVYLLGTMLFADTASSLDLIFLMPLRDLDLVAIYDWGSYTLAYLYKSMDETVQKAKWFCDFWHAVLVHSLLPFYLFFFLLVIVTIIA